MARDTLEVFGVEYTNVAGFKATDDNGNIKTYVRPQGTLEISANGQGIDVAAYAAVDVAVPSSQPSLQAKTNISPTTSSQTITADTGYDGLSSVQINAMPSGSASPAASISGTSATVSTGTNTLTLSKTVSNTPQVTAGYVASGTAGNTSVSLTASVTTQAAQTIYPSSSDQTIASGRYLTGTQTIKGVTTSNLTADNIKNGVTVTVGDSSDADRILSVTGTYSGGGSSTIQLGTKTATLSATASSISFTGLSGNPTSFVVTSSAGVATNTNGVTGVVWDGTNLHGQTMTTQVTADTGFSKSYSSGTLTVTATTAEFQANEYKLVYTYDGSSSDIHTSDVQVGSGATSITFSSLSGRPIYWSCIFKSNFSTSSGYQRVIEVVNDGTNIYGMAMDSSAKAQTSWSATYSGDDLTIASTGTNNGGYFHQPGYYQLTYAVDASAPQYQTKSVSYTPSTTQQIATVTPDNGYDALDQVNVTVNAMPSMTLPTSASATSSGTSKATITPTSSTQYLNIPTGYNATAQYYTIGASGGGSLSYDTKTVNASNYPVSLDFTGMKGEPKAFVVRLNAQVSSSGNTTYYYIVDISHFGTTTHGNCFRVGGTRRVENITSGYSYSYSGTTLTITSSAASRSASPGAFYSGSYELLYAY